MASKEKSKLNVRDRSLIDQGLDREFHELMDPLAERLFSRTTPDKLMVARRA